MNPHVFDNTYFKEIMISDESRYFKCEADHRLLENSETRSWVEKYAADNTLFFENFAKAHVALSELNCFDLMGEMNEEDNVDGGYQEKSRFQYLANWFVRDQSLDDEESKVRVGEFTQKWLAKVSPSGDQVHHHDDDHGHDDHHENDHRSHGHSVEKH